MFANVTMVLQTDGQKLSHVISNCVHKIILTFLMTSIETSHLVFELIRYLLVKFYRIDSYRRSAILRRKFCDPTLHRFHSVPACDGRTDGQTE